MQIGAVNFYGGGLRVESAAATRTATTSQPSAEDQLAGLRAFLKQAHELRLAVRDALELADGSLGLNRWVEEVTTTTTVTTEETTVTPATPGSVSSGALGLGSGIRTLGPDRPLAELNLFDGVVAGTITIQGTAVPVDPAVDSVNAIVAALDALGTVVASLSASNALSLARHPSSQPLTITSDTSGFLLATGVVGSIPTSFSGTATGPDMDLPDDTYDEATDPMADTTAFSTVSAGTLTVNGVDIEIDPVTGSMTDVLDAINATGVATASYDGSVVTLEDADGGALDLADTSGLLAALGIAEGGYGNDEETITIPVTTTETVTTLEPRSRSRRANQELADQVDKVAERVNDLFRRQTGESSESSTFTSLRETLGDALLGAFERVRLDRGSQHGVSVDLGRLRTGSVAGYSVFDFGGADRNTLLEDLRREPEDVREFLLGSTGMLELLDTAIGAVFDDVAASYGSLASMVRRYA